MIYRRVDDDFLDPLAFRVDSALGSPGLFSAYRAGNVTLANALGTGVADDKAIYAYVPKIIQLLPRSGSDPRQRRDAADDRRRRSARHVLDNLEQYVVKAVGESGGYGMLIGPHSSGGAARDDARAACCADPRNYIAQPVLALSTAPCFIDGAIEPRHVDLRPVRAVRREGHDRAGRADPRRAAQGLAGRQLVAGRRLEGHLGPSELTGPMLSRVADSLYWMSRYFERADNCARAIDATHSLMLSRGEVAHRPALVPGADGDGPAARGAQTRIRRMPSAGSPPIVRTAPRSSSCIAGARDNASQVREEISSEMWEQLNRLYHEAVPLERRTSQDDESVMRLVATVREGVVHASTASARRR